MWAVCGFVSIQRLAYTPLYMKIAIITNLYPPYDRGGAEQVVVKTVEGMSAAGHEVVVITGGPTTIPVRTEGFCRIYTLAPRNVFFYPNAYKHGILVRLLWHARNIFHLRLAKEVETILFQEQPEIVHTHNLMGLGFCIPRAIRRLHFVHVHTVHDVQLAEPSGMILKAQEASWRYTGFPSRMYQALVRWLFGSPNVVISPSVFLQEFYRSRGFFPHARNLVLRNPLTVLPTEPRTDVSSPLRIMFVGQIERHKGIHTLLSSIDSLEESYAQRIRLDILGSGSELDAVKRWAKDKPYVHCHGRVNREEIVQYYASADVTVVPSLCYENSPTVIFESFSFGIPVIASRIEGVSELIQEDVNGYTVPAGDSHLLARKIQMLIDAPEKCIALKRSARESITDLIQVPYLSRLLEVYAECHALQQSDVHR